MESPLELTTDNVKTGNLFNHLKPFLLLVFTFILSILWFIELSLILLCLSYTRCMRSVLITMEVPPTVDARQNFAITAVVLIVSFYLSFSDCLTTYITYKRNHYYEEFYFGRFHDLLAFHVDLHCSCAMIVYSSRFQLCQLYHIFSRNR